MTNQELIKDAEEMLNGEDEPHQSEWMGMIAALVGALEKADKELQEWNTRPINKMFRER